MSENGHISPLLVPNQALYQAEPQPELTAISHAEGERASLPRVFCGLWQGRVCQRQSFPIKPAS